MEQLSKYLYMWYYAAAIKAVVVAALGYTCVTQNWFIMAKDAPASITIYSVIILYVIITTPVALKLFSMHVSKLATVTEETDKLSRYKTYATWRITIIAIGLFAAIFFYYVLQQKALLWVAGISAIALYFCKPTPEKIENDLAVKTETPDEEPEEKE
ncbi:MAG TPA: hypothetical protein PLJ40_00970 [Paludibacteraceae bacterium]|jgi:uncharacterized membrane protein|nr:hypothetical protein [Paludibacteraceae bacterium]HQB68745.1 hypothetical protein [Paludibacteraceae bacterium]HRS68447.1 hypothetical protein [Paludibacteraceae bacterium]